MHPDSVRTQSTQSFNWRKDGWAEEESGTFSPLPNNPDPPTFERRDEERQEKDA